MELNNLAEQFQKKKDTYDSNLWENHMMGWFSYTLNATQYPLAFKRLQSEGWAVFHIKRPLADVPTAPMHSFRYSLARAYLLPTTPSHRREVAISKQPFSTFTRADGTNVSFSHKQCRHNFAYVPEDCTAINEKPDVDDRSCGSSDGIRFSPFGMWTVVPKASGNNAWTAEELSHVTTVHFEFKMDWLQPTTTPGSTIYPGNAFMLNMDASTHLDVERAKWCVSRPNDWCLGSWCIGRCLGTWCPGQPILVSTIGGGIVTVALLFCVGVCYCRRRRRRHQERNPQSVTRDVPATRPALFWIRSRKDGAEGGELGARGSPIVVHPLGRSNSKIQERLGRARSKKRQMHASAASATAAEQSAEQPASTFSGELNQANSFIDRL